MIRFPFVDLIEKLIERAKAEGSWVYWAWIVIVGVILALFVARWAEQGFSEARVILFVGLFIWLGGAYPVSEYEKHWKSKQKDGEK